MPPLRVRAIHLSLCLTAAILSAQVPTLVETAPPVYSDEALRAGLEGIVMVSALVGADGYAHDIRLARPLGLGLDEKAIEAVRMWRLAPAVLDGVAVPVPARIPVPFILPEKSSRWHLLRAAFETPDAAERASFLSTSYPPGAGISAEAYEQASLVHAMGRFATATISFDIDATGAPANFVVETESEKVWGKEAVAVVQGWRFAPARNSVGPVTSRCHVTLAWGRRELDQVVLAQLTGAELREQYAVPGILGEYTAEAALARIEGVVEVAFVLGADGKPRDIRVVRGLGHGLDEKAVAAIAQTGYRINGQLMGAEGVEHTLNVRFRLAETPVRLRK